MRTIEIVVRKKDVLMTINGKKYQLRSNDLPGLSGKGKITIISRDGCQAAKSSGDISNLSISQKNGKTSINGVDIEELVQKLEARQK